MKKAGRQANEMDSSVPQSIVSIPPLALTVEIQKGPKAKAFVVRIDKVKPFIGTPPTSWIVGSLESADVSDVPDQHADAAETEETEPADPGRLRRRLDSEPTSPPTQPEVSDCDANKEPVKTRQRQTIRRRSKRFDC